MAALSPKQLLKRDRISRRKIFNSLFILGKSINSSKDNSTYYVLDKNSKRNNEIVNLILNFDENLDDSVMQKMRGRKYDVFIVDKTYNERKYKDLEANAERTEISLSNMSKSPIFTQGNSAGSGGGAKNTLVNEVAQASYIQYFINDRNNLPRTWQLMGIDKDMLRKGYESVKKAASASFDDVSNISEDWVNSSLIISHKLLSTTDLFKQGSTYTVYHNSAHDLNKLKNLFNELNKEVTTSSRFFGKIEKWNPADIWIMNREGENFINSVTKKGSNSCKTLLCLNKKLKTQYENKNIIPISLKKAVGDTRITYYNTSDKINDYDKLKLTKISISKTSFFSSMDMYLSGKSGLEMQFRNYGNMKVQGEIKGAFAAGGKIGQERIVTGLRLSGAIPHMFSGDYNSLVITQSRIFERNIMALRVNVNRKNKTLPPNIQKFKEYLYDGYINYKHSSERNALDIDKFTDKLFKEKSDTWIFTKFTVIAIANLLKKVNQDSKDSFLRACYMYASSQTNLSAPFIKIGN